MSGKKATLIECRNASWFGTIDFYLCTSDNEYYLCSQKFRHGAWNFYKNGVRYERAVDFGKANNDHSVMNAMKRIRSCITYLEKYENVIIPEKIRRSGSKVRGVA